jgi:hypothetical protein
MNITSHDIATLHLAARRERARAMHRIFFAPLARFFREIRHAAGTHRAVAGS